ncbi:MAG: alpha/beta hydrolase [Porcipelethomonas sp.]
MLEKIFFGAASAALAAGAIGSAIGAKVLFDRVIPRQEQIRVNLDEFADMAKWEEYKKLMVPAREWIEGQKTELVHITARDGIKLKAVYIPAEQPSGKIVIGFHGYTSKGMNDFPSHAQFFNSLGFDVLIPDLRAHGDSEGDYVGFGILDRYDCLEWIRYINKRFDGGKKILLHGTSMGGTTVLMTSGFEEVQKSVTAIIADCAFTSPYEIFVHVLKKDYHLPPFPIMNINDKMCLSKAGYSFNEYSTIEALKTNKIPVLFIHGKDDKFVPTWMTEKNYETAVCEKQLLWVEGAGHGSSVYENKPLYEKTEAEFVKKYFD